MAVDNQNMEIVPLIDNISYSKRSAQIMEKLDRKIVISNDKVLNDDLAVLKRYLGDPEPGNRIIDAPEFHDNYPIHKSRTHRKIQ
jgi:hypothetical protein